MLSFISFLLTAPVKKLVYYSEIVCVYIYVCIHTYIHTHIYIYMDFGMLDCQNINCITLIVTEGKVG